jgi:hypothetical protein
MKSLPKIAEWLTFLFFLFAQLAVVGALYFCSLIVAFWLHKYRPGAEIFAFSTWCFKDGRTPYLEIACLIIITAIAGKIFERYAPMAYVLIPSGILLIFGSFYIAAFCDVTMENLGTPDELTKWYWDHKDAEKWPGPK